MLGIQLARFFHFTCCNFSASSKSLLAELRKKTGYSFSNCKKALETNDYDVFKAEQWLKEQAQAFGWAKASKLQGRAASQGLIGVVIDQNHAALVEINCETDFVARNEKFKNFVSLAADSCLQISKKQSDFSHNVFKAFLGSEQLKGVPGPDGKPLADHSALAIGAVGENVLLTRAMCLAVSDNLRLVGHAHPPSTELVMPMHGKYGAIVVLKAENSEENMETIGKQLCQHIIGMSPTKIGSINEDKPDEETDNESTLIFQEFLLDSEIKVQEVLEKNKMKVIDFVRFECSEELKNESAQDKKVGEQSGKSSPAQCFETYFLRCLKHYFSNEKRKKANFT